MSNSLSDCNDLPSVYSGIYALLPSTLNKPSEISNNYSNMMVFRVGNLIYEMVFPIRFDRTFGPYIRCKSNEKDWTTYTRLITSSEVISDYHETRYIVFGSLFNNFIIQFRMEGFDFEDGVNVWISRPLPISFSDYYSIAGTSSNNISGEIRIVNGTLSQYSISRSNSNLQYYSYIAIGF